MVRRTKNTYCTVEALINGLSKTGTAIINEHTFLYRRKLGQILIQKALIGEQAISRHYRFSLQQMNFPIRIYF